MIAGKERKVAYTKETTATGLATESAWSPLRHRTFTMLWSATVVSNIGYWMYVAAAGWQMTLLAPSPFMVSLVQAASSLPVFLFALPAGALADIVDRRNLLIAMQCFLLATALLLAALTLFDQITPWVLLALTCATGLGSAFVAPAWQAIVPELVPTPELQSAVALNSVGINISRAIGPALGGVFISGLGIASPYFADAVSFVGVILALALWRRHAVAPDLPAERFVNAMRTGLRYARENAFLRATLVRAFAFFLFASAYWALLPLVARDLLHGGPSLYGILLGCIGIGAVVGAVFLPRVRAKVGHNRLVAAGTLTTAATMIVLVLIVNVWVAAVVCMLAGASWIAVLSSLNISAQVALPTWVKARGLSVYLVVFFGSLTGGSILWGQVADMLGLTSSILIAAGVGVVALLAVQRWALAEAQTLDLAPSMHWPAPMTTSQVEHDRGPVMVTVEYRVDPSRAAAFIAALDTLGHERRRDGAFYWGLFEDVADSGRYVEYFMVESWIEHLRQHRRVTKADRILQELAQSFQCGDEPPTVTHLLAPDLSAGSGITPLPSGDDLA